MNPSTHSSASDTRPTEDESTWLGLNFAWELGYTIAIPAVLFGLGGAYIDRSLGTSPLLVIVGLMFAFALSLVGITRKIRVILDKIPKDLPKKSDLTPGHIAESHSFHDSLRPKS